MARKINLGPRSDKPHDRNLEAAEKGVATMRSAGMATHKTEEAITAYKKQKSATTK